MTISSGMISPLYAQICDWSNLLEAYHKAAKGKRGQTPAAAFEYRLADNLLQLQDELLTGTYQPGAYVHFTIHEPKRRKISAAPFRDRVVHHALCNVIEPLFERRFIHDSYANRLGKGTHRAIDRLQYFSRRYRYVLRCDIKQHFASLDHAVLRGILAQTIQDGPVMGLVDRILSSGGGVLADEYNMVYFPGDDLFTVLRPRGLPIGNLTSQFWSNCFMDVFDQFVKRELGCKAYVRYVDDFALFGDEPYQLYGWKRAIIARLARLRLVLHGQSAQVMPITHGIPWLGFIVCPTHRRLKARNTVRFTRQFRRNIALYRAGKINFQALDASVQGWVNHVCYGDTWHLRGHIFRSNPIIV